MTDPNTMSPAEFFAANPVVTLSTADADGPHARIVLILWSDSEGCPVLYTSKDKAMSRQIAADPRCVLTGFDARLGLAMTVECRGELYWNLAEQQRVMDTNPGIKALYQRADNPLGCMARFVPTRVSRFVFRQ